MLSSADITNLTEVWSKSLLRWHLQFFFIPTSVVTLATLLASPLLLTCILMTRALRQETRYLLVANTLIADMLFLIITLANMVSNAVEAPKPWLLCELVAAVTATTYCSAILTVTLMVMDTYAAVRWPLRYRDILPPARTHLILVGVWVLAAVYPLALVIVTEVWYGNAGEEVSMCVVLICFGIMRDLIRIHFYLIIAATICAILIIYCYIRLYMVTRTQGIWQSCLSRARVTLLTHGVLLLLYFVPGFIFTIELFLFDSEDISQDVRVWISTINMCVCTLLPRAFAPYVYGLRYRELSDTLMHLLHQHRRLSQHTVS